MYRLTILVGQLDKSVAPTLYFFKVPQVGRLLPLIGGFRRPVESPLKCRPIFFGLGESFGGTQA